MKPNAHKIFLLILFASFFLNIPTAEAQKRPFFPNASSLEPVPEDVYPDVSSNTNSGTLNRDGNIIKTPGEKNYLENSVATEANPKTTGPREDGSLVRFAVYFFVIAIILVLFLAIKNSQKADNVVE